MNMLAKIFPFLLILSGSYILPQKNWGVVSGFYPGILLILVAITLMFSGGVIKKVVAVGLGLLGAAGFFSYLLMVGFVNLLLCNGDHTSKCTTRHLELWIAVLMAVLITVLIPVWIWRADFRLESLKNEPKLSDPEKNKKSNLKQKNNIKLELKDSSAPNEKGGKTLEEKLLRLIDRIVGTNNTKS